MRLWGRRGVGSEAESGWAVVGESSLVVTAVAEFVAWEHGA